MTIPNGAPVYQCLNKSPCKVSTKKTKQQEKILFLSRIMQFQQSYAQLFCETFAKRKTTKIRKCFFLKMVWSQEEIDSFKARRSEYEDNVGKVDAFVCAEQGPGSPRRSSGSPRKSWKPTPTSETRRSNEWIGHGSPMGKKRSWKVKSIKPIVPDLNDDDDA